MDCHNITLFFCVFYYIPFLCPAIPDACHYTGHSGVKNIYGCTCQEGKNSQVLVHGIFFQAPLYFNDTRDQPLGGYSLDAFVK